MRPFVVFALLLLIPSPAAAQFVPTPIDLVVNYGMTEFHVPGAAVVVVLGDEVVYCKGYGVRTAGTNQPVTPDTVFAIASCSKAFTATLIAMLVDEGKLKWDDKVHDHLDYFRLSDELADREVTLRDLLCHRTGMPRHDMLWAGYCSETEDLIRRWGKARNSTSFRSTWEYSNVPFTTAGVIAGKLDKTDWAGATKTRIFDPLGMTNSSGRLKDALANPDHATPHYLHFDKSVSPVAWDDVDFLGGAGNVSSSARDMGQWLRFQLSLGRNGEKRLVKLAALKETHAQQMLFKPTGAFASFFPPDVTKFSAYGLGWFVTDYRGLVCVSHGGTLGGFRSQCMMLPEKKIGVFVVANLRPSLFPEAVAKMILDMYLGADMDWVKRHRATQAAGEFEVAVAKAKRDTTRRADTKPSREPKEYAGTYDDPAYGRAAVTLDGDKLKLSWGRYAFRLEHYHFDTFTLVPVKVPADTSVGQLDRATFEVQFRLAANGDVESLQFLGQEFKRGKP